MNIAIIPARGGSKRIPRKNIKEFHGKPMIGYAIEIARQSGLFQHIVVSTDDDEVAQVARRYGAEVPFIRPPEMANDWVTTVPVIAHAIRECRTLNWVVDKVCCIYPCVPFLQVGDLAAALKRLNEGDASYCFPIAEYPSPIQRALRLLPSGKTESFNPDCDVIRTQDLECAYFDAGEFYWGLASAWLANVSVYSNGLGYVVPNWRVVDIDTEDDWNRAERLAASIMPIR